MSREDLISVIYGEIENLNRAIDLKIITGRSYRHESRRHKFLLRQLRGLESHRRRSGWLGQLLRGTV